MPDPRPLWLQLRNHPTLLCLHPTPNQLAVLLDYLSDVIEWRGHSMSDLDPGETADWLRWEAMRAREAGNAV